MILLRYLYVVALVLWVGGLIVAGAPALGQCTHTLDHPKHILAGEALDRVPEQFAEEPHIVAERLVRIGGHFGPVVLSRLGAAEHQHVTATGDTVNVTSRLLEVAKQHASGVLVTEDLWSAAAASTRDDIAARAPVDLNIRGRAQSLRARVVD